MSEWAEILASFDTLNHIEGFLSTFRYADWRGAYDSKGIHGLIGEFFSCIVALNCWTIRVHRHAGWSGDQIEDLLFHFGVRIWGRGFSKNDYSFYVKERQARWAEYVLLCQGVPVTSRLYDPRNCEYAKRRAPSRD